MKAGLDIGNTHSKLGLFHENGDIEVFTLPKEEQALISAVEQWNISDLIVTSVTRELVDDETLIQKLDSFIWLSDVTPLPIDLAYQTPETLGRDRIATAVGAAQLFPEEHSVVIDAGTCLKVDFIESGKIFQGGYIAPGVQMRWEAMHQFTARLPLVHESPGFIIGKTTQEALGIGGGMAVVLEIEGYLHRLKKLHHQINVILTGGDGTFIFNNTVSKILLHPNLLMEGLREIQRFNAL